MLFPGFLICIIVQIISVVIEINIFYCLGVGLVNPQRTGVGALSVVLFHRHFSSSALGTLLSDINICNSNQLSCNFNKSIGEEEVLVGSMAINT